MNMNDNFENKSIDELIGAFGKREAPSTETMKQAQIRVKSHWQTSIKKQKTVKMRQSFLRIAASFVLFGLTIFFIQNSMKSTQRLSVATPLFAQGSLQVSSDNQNWSTLKPNDVIKEGQWLKLGQESYANLSLNDTSQLRINQNTVIHFDNANQIELIEGEIYHDADNSQSAPLLIKTSLGTIQHIGTRYAVSKKEGNLEVKVRSGSVQIVADNLKKDITKNQRIAIHKDGSINESTVKAYDPDWKWTLSANKNLETNHKSLNEFILWFAHENGYEIDWNRQKLQTKRVLLSGDFENLSSEELLKTVFLSTKFDFSINQGILKIIP